MSRSLVMGDSSADRDIRRNEFRQTALAVVISNVAGVVWLATGDRTPIGTLLVWFGAFAISGLGWILIVEKRRPKLPSRGRARKREPIPLIGPIIVVVLALLNVTWELWLPRLAWAPDLPISWLPDAFHAVRIGLTIVLGTSLSMAIWIAARLAHPQRYGDPTRLRGRYQERPELRTINRHFGPGTCRRSGSASLMTAHDERMLSTAVRAALAIGVDPGGARQGSGPEVDPVWGRRRQEPARLASSTTLSNVLPLSSSVHPSIGNGLAEPEALRITDWPPKSS